MRAHLLIIIQISMIFQTKQDVRYVDFGDSLDAFQDCSMHLIWNDLEVSLYTTIKVTNIVFYVVVFSVYCVFAHRATMMHFYQNHSSSRLFCRATATNSAKLGHGILNI